MISEFVVWLFGELVCSSRDGKLSMSRLAGCTAHFLAALFFIYFNYENGKFEIDLWLTYLGFATGHAIWDKSWMTTKGKDDAKPE
jgi:hypothetical protein